MASSSFGFVSIGSVAVVAIGLDRRGDAFAALGHVVDKGALWRNVIVTLGARKIEDELGLLVGGFLFSGDVGMQELGGDVGQNRGAAGRDVAFRHEDEEASEIFAKVLGGGELEWTSEEVFGEVGEVVAGWEARGEPLAEMARTKAELRLRTRKAAVLAIFIAMLAAGAGRGSGSGGVGFRTGRFWSQDFYVWGLCGHGWSSFCFCRVE